MKKIILLLILFFSVVFITQLWAQSDGVLIADNGSQIVSGKPSENPEIRSVIEDYTRQAIINSVIEKSGRVFERIVKQNNISLFAPLVYQSIQQIALQTMKQDSIKDMAANTFDDTVEEALKQFDEGAAQGVVQQNIKNKVYDGMKAVTDQPIFQRITEEILKQAMAEHRKIIAMTLTQRNAQLAIIEERKQIIEQALAQQLASAINNNQVKIKPRNTPWSDSPWSK